MLPDTATPEHPTDPARALREAVRGLLVAHGALDDACRPCGTTLPLPYAYALLELRGCPEGMTVTELAGTLSIDRTNVSRLAARMAASGELERIRHPADGRARLLRLTGKGAALAAQVDAASAAHFTRVLHGLDGEAEAIVDGLERLRRTMAALAADAPPPKDPP